MLDSPCHGERLVEFVVIGKHSRDLGQGIGPLLWIAPAHRFLFSPRKPPEKRVRLLCLDVEDFLVAACQRTR